MLKFYYIENRIQFVSNVEMLIRCGCNWSYGKYKPAIDFDSWYEAHMNGEKFPIIIIRNGNELFYCHASYMKKFYSLEYKKLIRKEKLNKIVNK